MCMERLSSWVSRSMQPSTLATAAAQPSITGASVSGLPSSHSRCAAHDLVPHMADGVALDWPKQAGHMAFPVLFLRVGMQPVH